MSEVVDVSPTYLDSNLYQGSEKGGLGTGDPGPMWGHSLSSAGTPKEPGGEFTWASQVAQLLKNLPAVQETLV